MFSTKHIRCIGLLHLILLYSSTQLIKNEFAGTQDLLQPHRFLTGDKAISNIYLLTYLLTYSRQCILQN